MLTETGDDAPEAICMEGLRRLERALVQAPMNRSALRLPPAAYVWLQQQAPLDLTALLAEKYGARFDISAAAVHTPDVI